MSGTGDGKINRWSSAARSNERGFDTTGDGKLDAWDTTGDGKIDAWDTTGDGKQAE